MMEKPRSSAIGAPGKEPSIDTTLVLEALERVRQSRTFANSEKLVQFLDFVVLATLRGEAESLKETVIGVGLYSREPDYDPKQDSIVRTQASRLRDRLEEYYRTEGSLDAISIRLNKGSYVPAIVRQHTPAPAPASSPRASEQSTNAGVRKWAGAGAILLAMAAVGTIIWMQSPSIPKVIGYTQLTHDGRPKWLVGTDGVRIYHGTGNFTDPGLAQVSVSGGESVPIQVPPGGLLPLGLSATGDKVLFSDYYPGNLWSLDLLGGSQRRLGEAVGPEAAWSPDGKSLTFCRGTELWVAAVDGTQARKLVSIPSRKMYAPQWSPDGTKLRFTLWEKTVDVPSLWEISANGTNPHPLLPGWHQPPDEDGGRWTVDGRYYVFQSQGQIWALAEKKWGLLPLVNRPVKMTNSPMRLSSPVPSPDGRKLFTVGRTERGVLVRHDEKLGEWVPYLSGIFADSAAFSKDGEWIAYVMYPELTLWRCRKDGTARLRLSDPPLRLGRAEWSPDGKRIIASGIMAGSTTSRTYLYSLNGGPPEVVNSEAPDGVGHPSWFPGGDKIAFLFDLFPRPMELQVFDMATHQRSTIPDSKDIYDPIVSPDGRRLVAIRRFPISLVIHDFQTGRWSELARVTGASPNWSRDGKYVYFLRFPEHPAVLKIRVSDGLVETAVDLKDFPLTVGRGWLGLTPDDSPLLLKDFGTQDVYALDLKN